MVAREDFKEQVVVLVVQLFEEPYCLPPKITPFPISFGSMVFDMSHGLESKQTYSAIPEKWAYMQ